MKFKKYFARLMAVRKKTDLDELYFEVVYNLAKKQKIEVMDFILVNHMNDFDSLYFIIKEIAYLNDRDALFFLMNHLDMEGILEVALEGAAAGGHLDLVNELIEEGANVKVAIYSAELTGNAEFSNEIPVENQFILPHLILGAVQGGHEARAKSVIASFHRSVCKSDPFSGGLMLRDLDRALFYVAAINNQFFIDSLYLHGAARAWMVRGLAFGGHIDAINYFTTKVVSFPKDLYLEKVYEEIIRGEHLKKEFDAVLFFLFSLKHTKLQTRLLNNVENQNEHISYRELKSTLDKITFLCNEHHLSFAQATLYLRIKTHEWVIHGPKLVKNNVIAADNYFQISAFVFDCSVLDFIKIFELMHQRIANKMKVYASSGFSSFFKSADTLEQEKEMLSEAYMSKVRI